MKQALAFIVIILLIIIAAILLLDNDANNQNTLVENFESWPTYESTASNGYQFSLKHPITTEISNEGGGVRLVYTGPNNNDPALTDGFATFIRIEPREDQDILEARAIDGLDMITVSNRPAFYFQTESDLNNEVVDNYIIDLDENTQALITQSFYGDEQLISEYKEAARLMRQSLVFDLIDPAPDDSDGSIGENAPSVNTVSLALLTDPADDANPMRGCDDIVMIERAIDPTTMPLTRAIELLFSTTEKTIDGARHFIPNTADTLSFDRATVVDGVANIYLEGELSGLAGVCDNPRAAIQIEETARQFASVESVQIYLNNEPTDLIPSER